jgi:hypothetical protein
MRRLSLCAVFLALTGSILTVLVVKSWANEQPAAPPKLAAKPLDADDPFAAPGAAAAPKSVPAKPSILPAEPPEEPPPPGLRPYPPAPPSPRSAEHVARAVGSAQASAAMSPSFDRILTPEMAASPEPKEAVEALTTSECAATAKINAALATPAEIDCKEMPLRELVARLNKRHKIEIQLDALGLKELVVDPDCPITKHLSGTTLRSALRLVLDDLGLKYAIHSEVLLITSPARAESDEFMLTKFYPVKDLILVRNEHDEIQTDFRPLMDLIQNLVVTKSWDENGGNGTIAAYVFQDRCLLVVNQTQKVHEEIADLLATLRRCSAADGKDGKKLRLPKLPKSPVPAYYSVPTPQPAAAAPAPSGTSASTTSPGQVTVVPAQPAVPQGLNVVAVPQAPSGDVRILTPEMAASPEPATAIGGEETPAETKIKAALALPAEIDCHETPLRDVVAKLKYRHKIEIQLDAAGLKDAGVEPETPVTKHLSGISLRAALRLLLDDLGLKYTIHNEVLLITSPTKAESDDFAETRFYLVKDLILVRNENGEIETEFQPLMDLIQNAVATKSWIDIGGNGAVCSFQFQDRCLLVITQSEEVHEQIANLLAAMRRCAATDAKSGSELQLPRRPKPAAAPGSPEVKGGGFM